MCTLRVALLCEISVHESHIMLTCTSSITFFYSSKTVVISLTATINELLTSISSTVVEVAWEIGPGEGGKRSCGQFSIGSSIYLVRRCAHVKTDNEMTHHGR